MGFPAVRELTNNVAVKRSHDADPGEHRRPSAGRDDHEGFHRSLPLRGGVLRLTTSRVAPASEMLRTVQSIAPPPKLMEPAFRMRRRGTIRRSSAIGIRPSGTAGNATIRRLHWPYGAVAEANPGDSPAGFV
jgi:hypothetical protein